MVGVGWRVVDEARGDAVLRDAATLAITLPGTVSADERERVSKALGVWAADAGAWEAALLVLRKSTARGARGDIARSLARCFACVDAARVRQRRVTPR